jgi:superfamily II DNA or RNA helicase
MSQGVNIPRLHDIIFFSSFRSKIKVLQSLGRGTRLHESKDKLRVYDIVDDLTYITYQGERKVVHKNYVYNHYEKRQQYYNEQKFETTTKELNFEIV